MAIIGQNRVDQVLTAHADERRVIFEDVAGISLYRMRKTEGLRKLEKTAENMERVKDMMALLDEQLVPFEGRGRESKKVQEPYAGEAGDRCDDGAPEADILRTYDGTL